MAHAGRVVILGAGRKMVTPPAWQEQVKELLNLGKVDEMDVVDVVGIHSLEGIEFVGVVVSFGFHVVAFYFVLLLLFNGTRISCTL